MNEFKIIPVDKIYKFAFLALATVIALGLAVFSESDLLGLILILLLCFLLGYPFFRLMFLNELIVPKSFQGIIITEKIQNQLKSRKNQTKLRVAFLIFYGFFFIIVLIVAIDLFIFITDKVL
jgi:hypothetical protein